MSEQNDFFDGLQNLVRAAAAADETYREHAFIEEAAKRLSGAEEIDMLIPSHYDGVGTRKKKIQLDGYDFGDEDAQIVLAIADYRAGDSIETLTMSDARKQFAAALAFLEGSIDGTLVRALEESSVAYQVATEIKARKGATFKVRIYLVTNALVKGRTKGFEQSNLEGITVEYHVWDLERFERVQASQLGREQIDIDLTEWQSNGVPALRTVSSLTGLETYLAVLPGSMLAGIYEKYGGRVLEANVRSFLSVRGGVNKGIKGTLQQQPEMFLAYNNGIAATASAITTTDEAGSVRLTSVRDLQIVNGGQTTASLFYSARNDNADLSEVSIQMKLIVVDESLSADLVPKISRFANTQNRVSEADFFSNHPFHVRMEEISRRLLAPAAIGAHFQTKWFYERTRGQYLNERARLSVAEARRFENEYPRSQLITKTDAAKYLVSWGQRPHTVSSGAQKNFIAFANQVSVAWAKDDSQFGEHYYRQLVAIGMLFNSTRALVQKSDWYSSGYLANIVTYTLAKLSHVVQADSRGAALDFGAIWKQQTVPADLLAEIEHIALAAFSVLTDDTRPVINVTEWAKREACWDALESLALPVTDVLRAYVISPDAASSIRSESKKDQRIDTGISAQVTVLNLGSRYWINLREFGKEMRVLTEKDLGIIRTATGEAGRLPSELQASHLLQLSGRMKDIGFVGN